MARPRAVASAPELPETLDALTVEYSAPGDRWKASVSQEVIDDVRGVLAGLDGPARTFVLSVLNGQSMEAAAARTGRTVQGFYDRAKKDPAFKRTMELARQIGTRLIYEAELEDIALDRSHRGQMRALELLLKARLPEYREKQQVEMTHVMRAIEAGRTLIEGYSPDGEAS